MSVVAYYAFLR